MLINLILNKIQSKYPLITNNRKLYFKIYNEIVKIKEKLSAEGADSINIEIDNVYNDETYSDILTVNELNTLINENSIIERILYLLNELINNIHPSIKTKIEIVISGGSLRIPFIQNEIRKWLNELKSNNNNNNEKVYNLIKTINIDECVATGCCYYGLILNGKWNYNIKSNLKLPIEIEEHVLSESKLENIELFINKLSEINDKTSKKASIRNEAEHLLYECEREIEKHPNDSRNEKMKSFLEEFGKDLKCVENNLRSKEYIENQYKIMKERYEDYINNKPIDSSMYIKPNCNPKSPNDSNELPKSPIDIDIPHYNEKPNSIIAPLTPGYVISPIVEKSRNNTPSNTITEEKQNNDYYNNENSLLKEEKSDSSTELPPKISNDMFKEYSKKQIEINNDDEKKSNDISDLDNEFNNRVDNKTREENYSIKAQYIDYIKALMYIYLYLLYVDKK